MAPSRLCSGAESQRCALPPSASSVGAHRTFASYNFVLAVVIDISLTNTRAGGALFCASFCSVVCACMCGKIDGGCLDNCPTPRLGHRGDDQGRPKEGVFKCVFRAPPPPFPPCPARLPCLSAAQRCRAVRGGGRFCVHPQSNAVYITEPRCSAGDLQYYTSNRDDFAV